MYLPVSSKTIKYHLDDCGIEIKPVKEFLTVTNNMYDIVLNRPGDPVLMGLACIEESRDAILFTNTTLSFSNRKKSIPDQMGYLEAIVKSFVRYAKRRNMGTMTMATYNSLLVETMVDIGFSLTLTSPISCMGNGKYIGNMVLNNKCLLPF